MQLLVHSTEIICCQKTSV